MKRLTKKIRDNLRDNRRIGLTIQELMDKYKLPKTTVWNNIHDVTLPERLKKKIRKRQGGSAIKFKKDLKKAHAQASKLLSGIDSNNVDVVLLSMYIGLYWAEGTKRDFVFTNTDESMIRVFMKYIYKYLKIPKEDIEVWVRMHSHLLDREATIKRHWARVTGVATSSIRINYDDRHNKSRTKYGICRIRLKKGGYQLKLVHSLIDGIIGRVL